MLSTYEEAPITYVAGLEAMTSMFGTLANAFIFAVVEVAEHDKIEEIALIVKAYLQLSNSSVPQTLKQLNQKPTSDVQVNHLKNLIGQNSNNFSLALLQALSEISEAHPDANQLKATISAYRYLASHSIEGKGLELLSREKTPTEAVTLALQDCLNNRSLEFIDPTVSAANVLFGKTWYSPLKSPIPLAKKSKIK